MDFFCVNTLKEYGEMSKSLYYIRNVIVFDRQNRILLKAL